jgi:hypothetical protein
LTERAGNQTVVVSKAVFNAPVEGRRLASNKESVNSKEASTFGARFVGSVQKTFVDHQILDWIDFVDRKLYLEHYIEADGDDNIGRRFCQKGYPLNSISPCQRNISFIPNQIGNKIPRAFLRYLFASANDPVYEKTIGGEPFNNLLQLRAWKIKNFLRLPSVWEVATFSVIQYESLLKKDGIASLIQQITGMLRTNSTSCQSLSPVHKEAYRIANEFHCWIKNATLWDVESLVGYIPVGD